MSLADLQTARHRFALCCGSGVLLSVAVCAGWWTTSASGGRSAWCRITVIALLPVELLWFAAQDVRQADRRLYFPRVKALEKLAKLPPGRIWGLRCLPPDLNFTHGLKDIRGYDAVDPADFVALFALACDRRFSSPSYATTQFAVPAVLPTEKGDRLHPVADLLNVRYLVLRKSPPDGLPAVVHEDDYWIVENPRALPRAFVPRSLNRVSSRKEALETMRGNEFEPRNVALVVEDLGLPETMEGVAQIADETPARVRLDVKMRTDGIVVVSDMWDSGWQAELDEAPCPIFRVNAALRGVKVPAGEHKVVMTYRPAVVRRGFEIAGAAALVALFGGAWLTVTKRRRRISA
jgi:hypothetical protein